MAIDGDALRESLVHARERLLAERLPSGWGAGELCASALSTATAVGALALVEPRRSADLVRQGVGWLAANANGDGGWGDSTLSGSNISTTVLCWCAFAMAGAEAAHAATVRRATAGSAIAAPWCSISRILVEA